MLLTALTNASEEMTPIHWAYQSRSSRVGLGRLNDLTRPEYRTSGIHRTVKCPVHQPCVAMYVLILKKWFSFGQNLSKREFDNLLVRLACLQSAATGRTVGLFPDLPWDLHLMAYHLVPAEKEINYKSSAHQRCHKGSIFSCARQYYSYILKIYKHNIILIIFSY